MHGRLLIAVLLLSCALGRLQARALAQSGGTSPRIGFAAGAGGYPRMAVTNQAFFDGLAEAGYVDGTNMSVVFRSAEGVMDRMPAIVRTLIAEQVDYLVVSSGPGCLAARDATREIPVLCLSVPVDPIQAGLVARLDKPGGNIVGVYFPQAIPDQIRWLREIVPTARTIGLMFDGKNATTLGLRAAYEAAAAAAQVTPTFIPVGNRADLEATVLAAKAGSVDLIYATAEPFMYSLREDLASIARRHRLPVIMNAPDFPRVGGLATVEGRLARLRPPCGGEAHGAHVEEDATW